MSSMIPQYSTNIFTDIYPDATTFVSDYKNNGIPYQYVVKINNVDTTIQTLTDTNVEALFYLLYARYGNSPLANRDITQFKYKLFSIIFQYGPAWQKELEVQRKIMNLSEDDIRLGSKAIYNQALNPQTEPSTAALSELTYINQQNTTNYKKSPLEGYAILMELLKKDVTEEFINKFGRCFKKFVSNERPIIYVTEEEEDEE